MGILGMQVKYSSVLHAWPIPLKNIQGVVGALG
jgi:hypothetical protein